MIKFYINYKREQLQIKNSEKKMEEKMNSLKINENLQKLKNQIYYLNKNFRKKNVLKKKKK